MVELDIKKLNQLLRDKSPDQIIEWALNLSNKKIVTTSFGVYSAILLSTITKHDNNIQVVWCDTLYNLPSTYEHAKNLISDYKLNIKKYQPLISKQEIETNIGFPNIEDENHDTFSEVVKLEPFRRALEEVNPEVWFTNIRIRQTELRDKKDILSYSKNGILKVSPFYWWTDAELDVYLKENNLPKNYDYVDPIKALQNRECGIHLQ